MNGITGFSIDITTLALTRGIMQMMLGGLLLYLGSKHINARDARWWAFGFVINGISLLVFPFEVPEAWELPRTVVNHLALGASSLFFLIGFWKFGQRPVKMWLLMMLIAIPAISLVAWEILWPNARYRVLCTAAGQVLYLIALQQTLLFPLREEVAQIYQRLRYAVMIYIVVYIWSYASIAELLPTSARQTLDYHRSIFSVASLLFMLTLAVGCLALQFATLAARNADLAMRDWLTGLLNRRGLFNVIRADKQLAKINATFTSLLAIDIDHFKKINDTHGHVIGDLVLQQFSQQLEAFNNGDRLFARMGGEEFLIVLFDTAQTDAVQLGETIRQQVECSSLTTTSGETIHFTISLGVYQVSPQENIELALGHVDEALYLAKKNGRNQVALLPASAITPEQRHFRSAERISDC